MIAPLRESRVVRLDQIVGVSDLNPRVVGENDVAELAASILALGQLQDLMVELDGASGEYLILDGQRRWLAMKLLVERGDWTPDALVSVSLAIGEDDDAARLEQALAANTMRRALHPVDEHEAFAGLAAAGASEERIARDFGLDVRRVRQRLALGKLSPKIREAWRKGEIDAEIARAYTAGATHEAQDAAFDKLAGGHDADNVTIIRRVLLADAIPGDAAEPLYVGEAAYLAAGGRISQDLFEETAHWLDGALAKRLAREKLLAEAEAIAAEEGWGFVAPRDERGDGCWIEEEIELNYTDAETGALAELEAKADALPWNERQPVQDAIAEIETRALLRHVPQAQRASLYLIAHLSRRGPEFDRGWRAAPAVEQRQGASDASGGERPEKGAAAGSTAAAAPGKPAPDKPGKALREVIDAALDEAFAASVRDRPDLALMIAVAKLGPTYNGGAAECVGLAGGPPAYKEDFASDLLCKIAGESFDKALRACAAAPLADLTVAFCEIVAASIRAADPRGLEPLSRVAPLAEALAARAAPLGERLDAALDREAYFAAAPKAACLAAAEAIGAAGIDKGAKKPVLAAQVASAAKASRWLPEPLASWARLQPTSPEAPKPEPTPDARPLAQAMAQAIDADEEARRSKIVRVCDLQGGAPVFGKFLLEQVEWADGLECKASDLRAAYLIFSREGVTRPLTVAEIGKMLAELGVEKKRKADGYVYLGIGLRAAPEHAEAAQ